MLYAAAVLLIIYLSIKLFPYLITFLFGAGIGTSVLIDKTCSDYKNDQENKQEVRKYILSNYSSYEDFKERYDGFYKLSEEAKKAVKNLFK